MRVVTEEQVLESFDKVVGFSFVSELEIWVLLPFSMTGIPQGGYLESLDEALAPWPMGNSKSYRQWIDDLSDDHRRSIINGHVTEGAHVS